MVNDEANTATHIPAAPVFNSSDEWLIYEERLKQYFTAYGIADTKHAAILLTVLANDVYKLLRGMCFPKKPTEFSFAELCKTIGDHFASQVCVFRERAKFYDANQLEHESVVDWLSRLKQLTIYCDFDSILEKVLRDKFVTGLAKGPILDKALELEASASLADCVKMVLKKEASIKMQFEEVHKISKAHGQYGKSKTNFRPSGKQGVNSDAKCFACAETSHSFKKCKYRQYTCKICKKKGHIAAACKNSDSMHYLEPENEEHIFNLNCDVENEFVLKAFVNNKPVSFQLDTGSAVTVFSDKFYKHSFGNVDLKQSHTVLKGYAGEIIRPSGHINVNMQIGDIQHRVNILVVPNGNRPLIGRDVIKKFKIGVKQVHNLDKHQGGDLHELLTEFDDLFSDDLGRYVHAKIKLNVKDGDIKPKFIKARTVPLAFRDKMDAELERLMNRGIITPIDHSDWATPLVPIPKGDGSLRVCADYKITVNPILEDVNYPLPLIDELFSALQGGVTFTKLDMKEAYTQFELDDETMRLLVWNTQKGLMRVNRLPYGTKPNTAIFQQHIEKTINGLKGVVVLTDDIAVTGKTRAEHMANLRAVFTRLKKDGFKLNRKKCQFFQDKVKYLGHIIDAEGLHMDPDKIRAIKEAPIPKDQTQVRAFVGMINYHARFLPNLSSILSPLFKLLKKDSKFTWDDSCTKAFEQAKQQMLSDEVLAHFNPAFPVKVTSDASSMGLGSCLLQQQPDGSTRPVAFASRTLTKAEQNYSCLDREALAIYFGVKKFSYYLLGRHFTLLTDHLPLVSICGSKKGIPPMAAGRLQRWNVFLSNYDFDIEYIKGSTNFTADCLSRLPTIDNETDTEEEPISYLNFINANFGPIIDSKQIALESRRDPIISKVLDFVNKGWPNYDKNIELKPYFAKSLELSTEREVLMWGYRVVIPTKLRQSILKELHSAHAGIVKMKSVARSYVWWPKIDNDIEKVANCCERCLKHRPEDKKSFVNPWPTTNFPFQRIHVDFLGPFHGSMYLVILDAYSKWPEVVKMQRITADQTISKVRECCARYGLPLTIVSDCGTQFTSGMFQRFCVFNGIKHITTAPFHPASNGAAENSVKSFKNGVSKAVDDQANTGLNIDTIISRYLLGYRSAVHSTTGETPYKRLFNREMRTRLDILRPNRDASSVNPAQALLKVNANRQEKLFDVGERVLARDFRRIKKSWCKATVKEVLGTNTFMVHNSEGLKWKRHSDQLRKWSDDDSGDEKAQPTAIPTVRLNPVVHLQRLMDSPTQNINAEQHDDDDQPLEGRPKRTTRPIDRLNYTK